MRTLLISHLSQRVSLRRTLDLISVKLRMREEAAAEDDELSQAAVHGQSATIDLDEDDGLGEALEVL